MDIKFRCRCGKVLEASANQAGKKGKCPVCGSVVQVPHAALSENKGLEEARTGTSEKSSRSGYCPLCKRSAEEGLRKCKYCGRELAPIPEAVREREKRKKAIPVKQQRFPSSRAGRPMCPRCGSMLIWPDSKPKSIGDWLSGSVLLQFVWVMTIFAITDAIFRPFCHKCGKISKLEIIAHQRKIPGIFFLWSLVSLIGFALIFLALVGFLLLLGRLQPAR